VTYYLPSSVAQRYVSSVIQTSLQLRATDICDQELYFIKQNWLMAAGWNSLDSLPPFLS
jgi:hypothetical protein